MHFLLEYDRQKGKLVSFQTFEDCDREKAQDARLNLELSVFRRGVDREVEVVILEAQSEEHIRRTHARYFYSLKELIEKFKAAIPAA